MIIESNFLLFMEPGSRVLYAYRPLSTISPATDHPRPHPPPSNRTLYTVVYIFPNLFHYPLVCPVFSFLNVVVKNRCIYEALWGLVEEKHEIRASPTEDIMNTALAGKGEGEWRDCWRCQNAGTKNLIYDCYNKICF